MYTITIKGKFGDEKEYCGNIFLELILSVFKENNMKSFNYLFDKDGTSYCSLEDEGIICKDTELMALLAEEVIEKVNYVVFETSNNSYIITCKKKVVQE